MKGPSMHPSRDWVALILAIGMCTALNAFVFFSIWDAVTDPQHAGLSENATQILTGWGGGIVGILGTVFGARVGAAQQLDAQRVEQQTHQPENSDHGVS